MAARRRRDTGWRRGFHGRGIRAAGRTRCARAVANLFSEIPSTLPQELIEPLLHTAAFRLERIVSAGHITAAGEWYDQEWDEWVILLTGSASLRFEGDAGLVTLQPGDHLVIPAHRRHRVETTDPAEKTIWLALHYRPE